MARQVQWLAADGTQLITLTDRAAGYRVMTEGTVGLSAPPYRFTTGTYAGQDGVQVQAVSAAEREVVLGLLLQASDEDELHARYESLVRSMRPKAGPGTLLVTNAHGRARKLSCWYTGGLEGSEARGTKLPGRWWKCTVRLLADDPWWYGDPQTIDVGLGAPTVFFPIFPLSLSPSTVQGQFTVDLSDSDTDTFPVWTITGPGSGVVLTNQTTGQSLSLDVALTAGQSMTVDTRPLARSARRDDGVNLLPQLTPGTDPSMWPLVEGVNTVTVTLVGATSASRVVGSYQPRYSGA